MGIPGLYSYICRNYKVVVCGRKSLLDKEPLSCDHLYIDTNALIHPCAQKVFNYGGGKSWFDPYAKLAYPQRLEKVHDVVCAKILQLIRHLGPQKSVMIAVDGVAPSAKQLQQRQRRYTAAKNKEVGLEFDANQISPGTKFMFRLHHRLIRLSVKIQKEHGLKVVYSSYLTLGEGEHKALDAIRKSPINESVVVVGPDGDLIILGLCLPHKKIFLVRDDLQDPTLYNIIDIGRLRKDLVCPGSVTNFGYVASLFGNDFLPRIQMFTRIADGLDYVLGKWDGVARLPDYFEKLLKSLAEDEPGFLNQQLHDQRSLVAKGDLEPKFVDQILEKSGIENLDYDRFRELYYTERMGITLDQVKDVCVDYISTLNWIHYYYTRGMDGSLSWEWLYPYFYAPLMTDLYQHYSSTIPTPNTHGFPPDPPEPFLQLLYILPPQSAECLPIGFRSIFADHKNYPPSFETDFQGKRYDHEAVVKLGFPDMVKVRFRYYLVDTVLYRSFPRNTVRGHYVFQ